MVDVFIGTLLLDFAPPVVSNILPLPLSVGVDVNTSITFDVTDVIAGVDLPNTTIQVSAVVAWDGTAYINGFSGTTTVITNGYHFSFQKVGGLPDLTAVVVRVDTQDMASPPNTLVDQNWTFTTSTAAVYHRYPYITDENPANGEIGVLPLQSIVFTVKSDDNQTPASAILQNQLIRLNGVTLVQNGINVSGGTHAIAFTHGFRQVIITIQPTTPMLNDTVYRIEGTFEDNAGNIGSDSFAFSTGAAEFAMQIDRPEPLLCPLDTVPVPLFSTNNDLQTNQYTDTVTSYTTDWQGYGLHAYDAITIADGMDAGRWLVRHPQVTTNRLYRIFDSNSTTQKASAYQRQEFADRNPVSLVFSPLFDYRLLKIWGDTQLRYLAGYPSDARFPIAFEDVPTTEINDFGNRIPGHVNDAVDGALSFAGTGSYVGNLANGSVVRFGNDTEQYVVASRTPTIFTIEASKPFQYHKRMSGTVNVVNGSPNVAGIGTFFLAELRPSVRVRFDSDPSVLYIVVSIGSDTTLTLLTAYGGSSATTTANVASIRNVPIHKMDNTNGGMFDDQLNKRLDFDLKCGMGVSSTKWDRYSALLDTKIKATLSDTALLTPSSATVVMSGVLYRDEIGVGAKVRFGTSSTLHTVVAVDGVLQQLTISPVWGGVLLSAEPIHRLVDGTRMLTVLRVTQMMPQTEFFCGVGNTGGSPLNDGESVAGCAVVLGLDGVIRLRNHLGSSLNIQTTDLTVPAFLNHDWVLETEFLDQNTIQSTLLDVDDLGTTNPNRTLTTQNSAVVPSFDRWTLTTHDLSGAPGDSHVAGYVLYADVEPGLGTPYSLGTSAIGPSDAKGRLARNLHNIPLMRPDGWKGLNVRAGMSRSVFTSAQYDRMFLDTDAVEIVIDSIAVEGGVTQQLSSPSRTLKKFSFKQGFDEINLSFRASRRGYWYALIDSDDPQTGLVAAKGLYDVANSLQSVSIDGMLFGGLADGPHMLNIVVCREPVPYSWGVLPGVANFSASASLLKGSGITIYGVAALEAQADVLVVEEEELNVIEDLSGQVNGIASIFTTGTGYRPGKIKLWLDGVLQNYNPIPLRVVETNNVTGLVALSSVPRVNQTLVAEYIPL